MAELLGSFVPMISATVGSLTGTFTWIAVMNPWALACMILFVMWLVSYLRTGEQTDTMKIVKQLVQSSAQWNTTSLQDTNKILSLMHAN